MKVPLSWIKDFVDINLSLNDLAHLMTMIGLEVEEVTLIGLPKPELERYETKFSGLSWDPEKFVVGQIDEVLPHPDADRLVLCRLQDGQQEHIVLTGAPNLFEYRGIGPLETPLKVAYAKEGAVLYDGHQPGKVLTKLKRSKIRGVDSYSMACSEKELGISDEHEGIIILDADAPTGMPLVDYMGDAVFDVAILPNMARDASVIGMAREIAAALNKPLRTPQCQLTPKGPSILGQVAIEITDPDLNPRFVFGLIRGINMDQPSPYIIQRRLRLAGMRPISAIVDATNYVMLETGEPLHAFDYDVLVERAGGKAPTIITRPAKKGEVLRTLDDVDRKLEEFMVLVTDTAGPLSLAGVMGGLESEITDETKNVLLEGAIWNFVNTRRTVSTLKLNSEAAYRNERGIHPELAPDAVKLCLDKMALWSGGEIAADLVDNYAKPYSDPVVCVTTADIRRHLGIELSAEEIAGLLQRLEFECKIEGDKVYAKSPANRLDIGEGVIGLADVLEEVSRLYGYDNIPSLRLADALPVQRNNPLLAKEEMIRDILVGLGLQEIITYRMTTPEREARIYPPETELEAKAYVKLLNPISQERTVMRRSVLASMLEIMEHNIRLSERLSFFEIGKVYIPVEGAPRPNEPMRLVIGMTGLSDRPVWDRKSDAHLDFYDLKGVVEGLLESIHVDPNLISYQPGKNPSMHPGKCADILLNGETVGNFGELHPLVKEQYEFVDSAILVAEIDLEKLINAIPTLYESLPVPVFPAVFEDLAIVVDEDIPAARVVEVIRKAGGKLLGDVRLFDIFRGPQIGEGKKSLAYSLAYQAYDKTLTDKDSGKLRAKIIRLLEMELGAKLRS